VVLIACFLLFQKTDVNMLFKILATMSALILSEWVTMRLFKRFETERVTRGIVIASALFFVFAGIYLLGL
jgi:hypothetical protein